MIYIILSSNSSMVNYSSEAGRRRWSTLASERTARRRSSINGGLGTWGRARRTVERGETRGCVGLRGDDTVGACVLGRRARLEDG
jgi:hypothetical protein